MLYSTRQFWLGHVEYSLSTDIRYLFVYNENECVVGLLIYEIIFLLL